jgi:hypothetical protein
MLVIVRNEGSLVYGGENLTEDLEQTFDHAIGVRRIGQSAAGEFAEISVKRSDGSEELFQLDHERKEYTVDGIVVVALVGFIRWKAEDRERRKPAVRLGFDAPRSYRLVRDNAIKRTE